MTEYEDQIFAWSSTSYNTFADFAEKTRGDSTIADSPTRALRDVYLNAKSDYAQHNNAWTSQTIKDTKFAQMTTARLNGENHNVDRAGWDGLGGAVGTAGSEFKTALQSKEIANAALIAATTRLTEADQAIVSNQAALDAAEAAKTKAQQTMDEVGTVLHAATGSTSRLLTDYLEGLNNARKHYSVNQGEVYECTRKYASDTIKVDPLTYITFNYRTQCDLTLDDGVPSYAQDIIQLFGFFYTQHGSYAIPVGLVNSNDATRLVNWTNARTDYETKLTQYNAIPSLEGRLDYIREACDYYETVVPIVPGIRTGYANDANHIIDAGHPYYLRGGGARKALYRYFPPSSQITTYTDQSCMDIIRGTDTAFPDYLTGSATIPYDCNTVTGATVGTTRTACPSYPHAFEILMDIFKDKVEEFLAPKSTNTTGARTQLAQFRADEATGKNGFCVYDPNSPSYTSPVQIISNCTSGANRKCQCGSIMCDAAFSRCISAHKICSNPNLPTPTESTRAGVTAYKCESGGQYISSSCQGGICSEDKCQCDGEKCPDTHEYCTDGICHSICGGTFCPEGNYCLQGACRQHEACEHTDGMTNTSAACSCGVSDCSAGQFCYANFNLCMNSIKQLDACEYTDGSLATATECSCGENECQAGTSCNRDHDTCTVGSPSEFTDSGNNLAIDCDNNVQDSGGNTVPQCTCGASKAACTGASPYCLEGVCKTLDCDGELCAGNCVTFTTPACTDGQNSIKCTCGASLCQPNEHCNLNHHTCSAATLAVVPQTTFERTIPGSYYVQNDYQKCDGGGLPSIIGSPVDGTTVDSAQECRDMIGVGNLKDQWNSNWNVGNAATGEYGTFEYDHYDAFPYGCSFWYQNGIYLVVFNSRTSSSRTCASNSRPCLCRRTEQETIETHLDCSSGACLCGGNVCNDKCFAGGYCGVDSATLAPAVGAGLEGVCTNLEKCSKMSFAEGKNTAECQCGPTTVCEADKYCDGGVCYDSTPCTATDGSTNAHECMCGTTECDAGQRCYAEFNMCSGSSITIVNGQAGTPDTFNVVATGTCEDAGNESITSDTECQVAGNNAAVNSKFHTWFVEWEHNIADDLNNCNTPTNFPMCSAEYAVGCYLDSYNWDPNSPNQWDWVVFTPTIAGIAHGDCSKAFGGGCICKSPGSAGAARHADCSVSVCNCGGTDCTKKCFVGGGCHATAKPPNCEYTDGSRKESAQCVCGGETCPPPPAGQRGTVPKYYCIDGGCTDTDYCPSTNGTDVVGVTCMCGDEKCSGGQYCHNGECLGYGACADTNRLSPTTSSCRCGDSVCDGSQPYCDGKHCHAQRMCPDSETASFQYLQTQKCVCQHGGGACELGQYCTKWGCSSFPACENGQGASANSQDCQCNSNMCTNGQYCRQDLSHCSDDVILEPCSNTIATAKSAAICKCGDSVCAKDQYCLAAQGMCSDAVPELWERYYVQPTDVPGNQESGKAYQCVNTAHTIQSVDACADAKTAGVTDVPVSSSPIYPVLEESGRRIPVYAYGCMAVSDSQSPNHVTGKFNDWYYRDPESSAPAAVTVVNTADHRCDTLLNEAACNTALSLYWQYSEYESMYTVPVGEKNDYPAGCSFHDTSGSQYLNRYRANFNSHVPSNDLAAHSPVCNVNYYSGIGYFECLCGAIPNCYDDTCICDAGDVGVANEYQCVAGTNTVCGGEACPATKFGETFDFCDSGGSVARKCGNIGLCEKKHCLETLNTDTGDLNYECTNNIPCANTDGTVINSGQCICGTAVCNGASYCYESENMCTSSQVTKIPGYPYLFEGGRCGTRKINQIALHDVYSEEINDLGECAVAATKLTQSGILSGTYVPCTDQASSLSSYNRNNYLPVCPVDPNYANDYHPWGCSLYGDNTLVVAENHGGRGSVLPVHSCSAARPCVCKAADFYDCTVEPCVCGTTQECSQQCHGGTCVCDPDAAADITGSSCQCTNPQGGSDDTCAVGERCNDGTCVTVQNCADLSRTLKSAETLCFCGVQTCALDQFCDGDTGICHDTPEACVNTDRTVINDNVPNGCMCGVSEKCDDNRYCDGNACQISMVACPGSDGSVGLEGLSQCSCMSADSQTSETCTTLKPFCNQGACKALPKCSEFKGMVAIAFECACQDELYCEVGKYCHTRLGGYARAAQSLESGSKLCKDYNLNVVDDPTSSDHYWEESVTIEECASYCWGRHDAVGELYTGFRHEYGGTDDKYSNTEGNCFCMALRWNSDLCDTNAEKTVHSTYYQYDFAVDATTVKKEAACLDFPHCDNAGYTPAGQSGCTCGNAGVTCPEGQYCHKSECSAHPYECLNTHGHTKNALGCRCGNETCADGKFCHKDDDTVNKQCADTDSSAFMLKIDESCKPGLEIDDFTKCKAFCERFGNPDDPGNCEVRDVVANDGFVSLYYPPGCSYHTSAHEYYYNSNPNPRMTCLSPNFECVCFSTDTVAQCADTYGANPLPARCLCEQNTMCDAGEYCYLGGCTQGQQLLLQLREDTCPEFNQVNDPQQCAQSCLSRNHTIERIDVTVIYENQLCNIQDYRETPKKNGEYTKEECRDLCVDYWKQGLLDTLAVPFQGSLQEEVIYATKRKNSATGQNTCRCHKPGTTAGEACEQVTNRLSSSAYDVLKIEHRKIEMHNVVTWKDYQKTGNSNQVCNGAQDTYQEHTLNIAWDDANSGEVASKECGDKCFQLITGGELNSPSTSFQESSSNNEKFHFAVKRTSEKICRCYKLGTPCDDGSDKEFANGWSLFDSTYGVCNVREWGGGRDFFAPAGCSLDVNELTYAYVNPSSFYAAAPPTPCGNMTGFMCVCGESLDGNLPKCPFSETTLLTEKCNCDNKLACEANKLCSEVSGCVDTSTFSDCTQHGIPQVREHVAENCQIGTVCDDIYAEHIPSTDWGGNNINQKFKPLRLAGNTLVFGAYFNKASIDLFHPAQQPDIILFATNLHGEFQGYRGLYVSDFDFVANPTGLTEAIYNAAAQGPPELPCTQGRPCISAPKMSEMQPATGTCLCPNRKQIEFVANDPIANAELTECQMDCDSDSDCAAGLGCFQRDNYELVPGCLGMTVPGTVSDKMTLDVCFDPNNIESGALTLTYRGAQSPWDIVDNRTSEAYISEVKCDADGAEHIFSESECAALLGQSIQADTSRTVGSSTGQWQTPPTCVPDLPNYYNRAANPPMKTSATCYSNCGGNCGSQTTVAYVNSTGQAYPTQNNDPDRPSGCVWGHHGGLYYFGDGTRVDDWYGKCSMDTLTWVGGCVCKRKVGVNPVTSAKLGECEGHCTGDSDCSGNLVCFSRKAGEGGYVPGCKGNYDQDRDADFCVDPYHVPKIRSSTMVLCKTGKYCSQGECHDSLSGVVDVSADLFLESRRPADYPACNADSSSLNADSCRCGTTRCLPGKYCTDSVSLCESTQPVPACANLDGTQASTAQVCQCGAASKCTINQHCYYDTDSGMSACSTAPFTFVAAQQATTGPVDVFVSGTHGANCAEKLTETECRNVYDSLPAKYKLAASHQYSWYTLDSYKTQSPPYCSFHPGGESGCHRRPSPVPGHQYAIHQRLQRRRGLHMQVGRRCSDSVPR